MKLKKFFQKHWLIFVFILLVFLRLPSLFEPFTYGDEGIYLTLGQAWRKGAVFYRDIHDNKPPLLYLLAGAAYNFTNYRLALFLWSAVTVYFFSKLARLLFKKNNLAVFFSTLIFVVLSSIRLFEGTIANAENFLIGTSIIGFYLLLSRGFNKPKNVIENVKIWFLAGILFSLSALFKVPGAFDFAAALAFGLLVINRKNSLFRAKRETRFSDESRRFLFIIHYSLFILGFLLPITLTFIYYASQNALSQYLIAAFSQNFPYLTSWVPDKPQAGGLPLPLLSRGLMVFLVFCFLLVLRKKVSTGAKLTLLWFSFSLFAALLSSRPYPHYLLQTTPPLALSFGLLLAKGKEKIIPFLIITAISLSMIVFHYWHYPTLSYYQNFYSFAFKQKTKNDYFSYFGDQAQDLYQAAAYIKVNTSPEEKIFIWGNQPSIYPLSERLPVGRYTVAYHIVDFNGYEETMVTLQASPPRYIVRILAEKRPFTDFENLLKESYFKARSVGEIEIYHRR